MRRFFTIAVLVVIAAGLTACEDGSSTRKFGGRSWSESLSTNDQALERAIIADIMGGIIADTIIPEEMSLSGVPPMNSKISISVPLENSYTPITETFDISSFEATGALTITIYGEFEELNVRSDTNRQLRFFPIEVVFSFNEYTYTNSCGLPAIVTGNIACRLQGTVNRATDVLDATGSCGSGTIGSTGTLLYRLNEEEYHDVFVQATVRAKGPWYELTSYQLYGNYMLDRRTGTIDSIIARTPQTCEY